MIIELQKFARSNDTLQLTKVDQSDQKFKQFKHFYWKYDSRGEE